MSHEGQCFTVIIHEEDKIQYMKVKDGLEFVVTVLLFGYCFQSCVATVLKIRSESADNKEETSPYPGYAEWKCRQIGKEYLRLAQQGKLSWEEMIYTAETNQLGCDQVFGRTGIYYDQ